MSFRALVTDKDAAGVVQSSVQQLDDARLPEGNVTVDIDWAGLNYKDGLVLTGAGGLVRNYPHVAGIDFAGIVRDSADPRYVAGQPVVLTGWRVGEAHWGGYAERARVNADWLVPLPDGLSTRDAMIVGTAGLTAMLSINRLEAAGLTPAAGDVLVTGAAGGVGSIATAMLGRLGYDVTALSGRPQHAEALLALGASAVMSRDEFLAAPDKPLESARWAAAIDSVGGKVLGKLLKQVNYGGAVAALGNAGGIGLETNVLPFILRGVTLIGIDSVMQPYATRVAAWSRIVELFDPAVYGSLVHEIGLEDLPAAAKDIIAGNVRGRLLVKPR
ncbi:acryloyl-CoA reductase [Devosia limi DSM 17137]|uniref:Acryloyl-CoA reductase n=1 Tax=Devosia limi DSM 17137 TaxID=1121477 RepID=A0A0F5LAB2_9HYPH|nr:MDR family oxidoreductase [Devosia limi]KKB79336.1 acryloyl-CoA reductase [Devosia limi DSM 17137]SHF29823.1 putative quinone oxidoreductase, YhdH/YhfP family [Devosia limi DSM 17137]